MTITGITESVVVRTAYSNNTRMLGVMMRLPDGRPIIANLKKVSEDNWEPHGYRTMEELNLMAMQADLPVYSP